jgi:hypothetical protein
MTFLCCCAPSSKSTKSKLKTDDLGSFAMNSMEDEPATYTASFASKNNSKVQPVKTTSEAATKYTNADHAKDYKDLEHIARKREIRVTIRKGTQAGVAAGLTVMTGVIMAGPVGAIIGGAIGTAVASRMAKNVVSLNDLLQATPAEKRKEVLAAFHESFQDEFNESIRQNPELKLLMSGTSIFGVTRYMLDRELLKDDQLKRLDGILKRIV